MNWLTLTLLTLINLLNYLDRYLLAALLPLVSSELNLSHEQGGTVVSAFVIGYFLFSPIFGYLGDRGRRPILMAIGVTLWCLATLGTSLVATFATMLAVRILVGVGEASFATIAPGYMRDRVESPERLNNIFAIFFSAIPVGSACAYVLAGILVKHTSWHNIFLVGGGPGLLMAAFLLFLPDRRVVNVEKVAPLLPGLREVLKVPELQLAIGGYALQAFALNTIAAFVTQLGAERGFAVDEISTSFGIILVVTGLIGTLLGGKISSHLAARSSDKIRSMFFFVAYTAAVGVPCLVASFMMHDKILFLSLCAVAELAIFAGTAPLNSIIVLCAPPALVTLTQGLTIASINLVGALLGPILVGSVADHFNLPFALQLTSISLASAVALWWWGGVRRGNKAQLSEPRTR